MGVCGRRGGRGRGEEGSGLVSYECVRVVQVASFQSFMPLFHIILKKCGCVLETWPLEIHNVSKVGLVLNEV